MRDMGNYVSFLHCLIPVNNDILIKVGLEVRIVAGILQEDKSSAKIIRVQEIG